MFETAHTPVTYQVNTVLTPPPNLELPQQLYSPQNEATRRAPGASRQFL